MATARLNTTVRIAIQTLVPSDAIALPRGANTRCQNVNPYCDGSLLGKYQRSANAHSTRLSSGPTMTNASSASNNTQKRFGPSREEHVTMRAPSSSAALDALHRMSQVERRADGREQ